MPLDISSPTVLSLDDVTFRRENKEILHGVSLRVSRGERWVMLGANGAGKSTILGFCGAVTHPTSGIVRVLGHQLGRVELQALRRHIGHVNPRHPVRPGTTVREVVLTGITGTVAPVMRWRPGAEELARADELIETLGLARIADDRWQTLSQGERGRALVARALICDPALLLMDEPTTGLDVAAREQLLDTIDLLAETRPDLSSMLVTHHLEELPATTTHALLLADGRVVASGPAPEVLTSANVTATFDYPIEVEYRDGRWNARTSRPRRSLRNAEVAS
ncbi:ABC transporter ATP-binding protein [Acidipropionibacterium thoenii]|uniref:ABC transporter ATP-binding protein n=1 Tax=Acidipropionibacterium thoenii TaxID=1751 RepID=UPI00041BAB8E|nr:ATP-binding cassette domain-containing protein [Acidipropionibacterium thoenii]